MTNGEAINWIINLTADIGKAENQHLWHYEQALAEIREILESAPCWIPCSERLPEVDGRYLVTCKTWGVWVVDWNIWHNEPKPSWLWEHGLTAWMPLPEAYEPTKEGET